MLIALHQSHHSLPFWSTPQQPEELFEPEVHGKLVLTLDSSDKSIPIQETRTWQIFKGIHAIEIPVMAHVSAFCNCGEEKTWHFSHRIWVHITTIPKGKIGDMPLVVKDEKVLVERLWGGDNGTYSPLEFLQKYQRELPHDETFWKEFFETKLKTAKTSAINNANAAREKAKEVADLYAIIPD